ncbi:MAG: dTDP-4-dehydrorhamnose reductase [Candidatus Aenigmatarchaeota archaeon]
MDKVLVIGASGLLGNTAIEIGKDKYKMFGTYNTHAIKGENFFHLDVTKRNDVFRLIEKIKPDLIFDTHALHNVDYCETNQEEAWLINVEGTKNVAEASKRIGAKYIFISTDYVFDGKKLEYTEKDKPNPLNYYAKTKWCAELLLRALDINYIVARTSVLYGINGMGKLNFVLWLIEKLKKKETVNIVTDQHNNPTLANNLVDLLFRLFEIDAKGIFHITGKDCLSRYEFSNIIAKTFNLDRKLINPITTPQLNQIAKRPGKVNMNTNKVERVTGKKTLHIEEALKILKQQIGE